MGKHGVFGRTKSMHLDILTLFPNMFNGVFSESIPKIALKKGIASIHLHDIRNWSRDKHGKVDDRPFGGGPGMVMTCQPLMDAVLEVTAAIPAPGRLIFLTPEGRVFDHGYAAELAAEERLVIVCGRYEGFDERIFELLKPERLSIGDFILSGGEIAAMAVVDAVIRLLPGVLGSSESASRESFQDGLLDHPHYTQPAEYAGLAVPGELRSGDHARIAAWRRQQAVEKTKRFRPDLLEQ